MSAASINRVLPVSEASGVGEARRAVLAMAELLGMSSKDAGRAALVTTELGTNLVAHAKGGELLVRPLARGSHPGVEVLAIDRGPGIANLAAALQDGRSTAGTAGNGLGALRRVSSEFDVHSSRPGGTVVLSRIWAADTPAPTTRLEVEGICVPYPGEEVAGDGWDVRPTASGARLMVADGLGHGPFAHEAAEQALSVFRMARGEAPAAVLEACHLSLRATRGAAVALAEVDVAGSAIRYCGVGNISGRCVGDDGMDDHLVSANGTIGLGSVRPREFTYRWPGHGVLVMWSDGIQTNLDLGRYPGLRARHAAVVAALIYRDHARGRDDVTVVVAKERG